MACIVEWTKRRAGGEHARLRIRELGLQSLSSRSSFLQLSTQRGSSDRAVGANYSAQEPLPPPSTAAPSSSLPSGVSGLATVVQGAACTVVSTLATAQQAVEWLQQQPEVALDTEGDLERSGSVSLVQLFAAGRAYIFDLHAMQPTVHADVLGLLRRLLESASPLKVIHDCRKDAEALFYLHDIRLAGMWDTQVAQALLGALNGMGSGGNEAAGSTRRKGLNQLLELHELTPNPHKAAMHRRMDQEPDLWKGSRPLEHLLLEYAVADVTQLLPLREKLGGLLGTAGSESVQKLSRAYAEWYFDEADRSYACGGTRSYAAATKLPLGCDMEMLMEPPTYKPRFVVALAPDDADNNVAADSAASSSSTQAQFADQNSAGNAVGSSSQESKGGSITSLFRQLLPGSRAQLPAAAPAASTAANSTDAPEEAEAEAAAEAAAEAEVEVDTEADCILGLFPDHVRQALQEACNSSSGGEEGECAASGSAGNRRRLIEIVVDKERPVVARFSDDTETDLPCMLDVEDALAFLRASKERLHLGDEWGQELFYGDNRTGIPQTLHRISAIRGRDRRVLGLTYRIGRHVAGVSELIMDLLAGLTASHRGNNQQLPPPKAAPPSGGSGEDEFLSPSLLLLGPPGVGKTTLLRDVTGILADRFRKRVIVVDTSNEIAGDGDVPHPCVGRARRMMVPDRSSQHAILTEAVQNHTPQVLVIDEIGTAKEVAAAKSIAQRGVVMVGTAHGVSLENLLKNPELNPLVGGVHQVLLGDREAKESNSGVKTRTERRGAPCFATLVEVLATNCWRIHPSVARSVDAILAGRQPPTQLRWVTPDGRLMVRAEGQEAAAAGQHDGLARQALQTGLAEPWFRDLINLAALY